MPRSSQTKEKPSSHSRQYISNNRDKDGNLIPTISSNQRLSGRQIIIFWSGAVVFLFAAFIIGFKAGQKIGAKEVLDQAANQVVRLPIVRPIGRESETVSLAKLEQKEENKVTPKAEDTKENLAERKIDFSSQSEGSVVTPPTKEEKENTKKPKAPVESKQKAETTTVAKAEVKSEEPRYEIIYKGKGKFLPPEKKNDRKEEVEVKEAPLIDINPVQKEPEKQVFNVSALDPSAGWYVQVTAVPTLAEVEKLYDKLNAKNISIRVESASIRNRPYYRILFGPFNDRASALEKRISSKTQAGTPGEPFIRQVK